MNLGDVWQGLTGPFGAPGSHLSSEPVTGFAFDSRQVKPGTVFVAIRGERADGTLYLEDAFSNGAVAAIAEHRVLDLNVPATYFLPDGSVIDRSGDAPGSRPVFVVPDAQVGVQNLAAWWRGHFDVTSVGVTGSVGKTTSKEIIANVLATQFRTLRSEGNYNNELGVPLTLLKLTSQHQALVLEMGMYAIGEIRRLCELAQPRIGVVTNIGPVHLERLGTLERIVQAKAELVQSLPSAENGGVAILNADDSRVLSMAGLTRARAFTYGLRPECDIWADEIRSHGLEGIRFRFHYREESLSVRLPLLGRHSVHTALRGAAVGLVTGLSWTEILQGLSDLRGQLRLLVVPGVRDTTLVDDTYNASPDSMLAALNLLDEIANASHRAIAVLGDMFELGSYDETGHRLVGGRAAQVAKKLVAVGPRARWTADEAIAGGMAISDVYPVQSNHDAVAVLQGLLQPGDIVLIKGSRSAAMESIVDALSQPRDLTRNPIDAAGDSRP